MGYKSIVALAALCAAAPASAATYTVATNGSDSNDGVSAPFRTLQKAERSLRSGDTIVLQAGTYTAGAYIEESNITIRGVGDVILDGGSASVNDGLSVTQASNITLENLTVRNCRRMGIFVTLSQGLTVRNCTFTGNGGSGLLTGNTSDVLVENCQGGGNTDHGVYLSQSGDRLTVTGCKLWNNKRAGLQINAVQEGAGGSASSDGLSHDCRVEGNVIWGNGQIGGSAIQLMGVNRSLLVNNLIYSNLSGGISLWDDGAGAAFACKNNRLFHNTILFDSGVGRYGIQVTAGSTGNVLRNNILGCGRGPALEANAAVDSNYNCFWASAAVNSGSLSAWQRSSGNDGNSFEGDPGMGGDMHLAAGGRGVDAGVQIFETDREGRARPQGANPDLGCYELGGDAAPVTPPVTNPDPDPDPTTPTTPAPETPAPPVSNGSEVIYADGLRTGWSARRFRSRFSLTSKRPVKEGYYSLQFLVQGVDGAITMKGPGISLAGKSVLRFSVHGGRYGGQRLRVRSIVDGRRQTASLNLLSYGGAPQANGWKEYVVPLADLEATAGNLTGLQIFAGRKQKVAFIDDMRVE